jgi:vacuolar protein sorting-associated protein 13B
MFKLESYITPLILSRVERYVKNVRSEDSQVSLWGGDAVLNNLDLKLDVLEEELRLPFRLVSGLTSTVLYLFITRHFNLKPI